MLFKFKKITNELIKLSNQEKVLMVKIVYWLLIGTALKKFLPFKIIANKLGIPNFKPYPKFTSQEKEKIENIRKLFLRVAYHLPIHSACLVRAFAMAKVLKSLRIPYTAFIGVSLDNEKKIKAHAWVRSGDINIIGCDGDLEYRVISVFGYE
jgi:hypothetical protein